MILRPVYFAQHIKSVVQNTLFSDVDAITRLESSNKMNSIRRFSTSINLRNLIHTTVNTTTKVATVSLNNPPVNALSLQLMLGIKKTFNDLAEDKNVNGVILTSSLGKVFCAGLDITQLYKCSKDKFEVFWTALRESWLAAYSLPKPLIVVVNGHAIAGGCLFANSAEYRIMTQNSRIGLNEVILAVPVPFWVSQSMIDIVGQKQGEFLVNMGDIYNDQDALKMGMVDQLVSDKSAGIKEAEKLMERYLKADQVARRLTKYWVRKTRIDDMRKGMVEDGKRAADIILSEGSQAVIGQYLKMLGKNRK